ncbi:MAG TPA: hypothetical protein VJ644_02480 [Jiangellaceae bacterium]|nr:hypothetical protein [Jiangellaceae bacterium]
MELVRKFPKGHAIPPPKVPWYEATVAYLLLVPAAITWFLNIPLIVSYWACAGAEGFCSDQDLLESSTGSYTGIVLVAVICMIVALGCAIAVQLTVRKLHFVLVWTLAIGCLLASIYAYAVMSGLARTPWGHLIPL